VAHDHRRPAIDDGEQVIDMTGQRGVDRTGLARVVVPTTVVDNCVDVLEAPDHP
jgi:hypothetical protein